MTKSFKGLLFAFAETGTEGWLWAVQENYLKDYWSYRDLHIIRGGDHLTIYDKDDKEIWSDIVRLKPNPNYSKDNIPYLPENFNKDEWIKVFTAGKDEDNYKEGYTGKINR